MSSNYKSGIINFHKTGGIVQDFEYLVKKRDRALGLFQRVIRRLKAIEDKISKLLAFSTSEVAYHNTAINFFNQELAKTQAHRAKIENLTSVSDDNTPPQPNQV